MFFRAFGLWARAVVFIDILAHFDATAFPAYLTGADAVRAGGHSDAKVMVKQMELCISRIVLGVRDSVNRSTGQPLDCPPIYVPNI